MKLQFLVPALLVAGTFVACHARERSSPPTESSSTPGLVSPSVGRPAYAALDALDPRIPVPMVPMMANHQKQNMRDHLGAVQDVVAAVATKDFSGVARAAGRMGYSEQMGTMCSRMGAGAPGFTESALTFHHTADTIVEAAKHHDLPGVIAALAHTLATCTNCHAAFKQQVVDDATSAASTHQSATPIVQ